MPLKESHNSFGLNRTKLLYYFPKIYNDFILLYRLQFQVCQWLAAGQWFPPGTPVSSTNKTDYNDTTEILLKVALNTINKQTNRVLELFYMTTLRSKFMTWPWLFVPFPLNILQTKDFYQTGSWQAAGGFIRNIWKGIFKGKHQSLQFLFLNKRRCASFEFRFNKISEFANLPVW
jgi:hypothetical protein